MEVSLRANGVFGSAVLARDQSHNKGNAKNESLSFFHLLVRPPVVHTSDITSLSEGHCRHSWQKTSLTSGTQSGHTNVRRRQVKFEQLWYSLVGESHM